MSIYKLEVIDINSDTLDLDEVNEGVFYFLSLVKSKSDLIVTDMNIIEKIEDFPIRYAFNSNLSDDEIKKFEEECLKPLEDEGLTYILKKDHILKNKKIEVGNLTSLIKNVN